MDDEGTYLHSRRSCRCPSRKRAAGCLDRPQRAGVGRVNRFETPKERQLCASEAGSLAAPRLVEMSVQ